MKKIALLCMLCCVAQVALAIEAGLTYRVTSKKFPTKSLIVRNSAREAGSDIVLWTETDVPSQQWTAQTGTTSSMVLQNVYTELYAMPKSRSAGGTLVTGSTKASARLVFEAVEGDEGVVRIKPSASTVYLTVTTGEDGEQPILAKADDSNTGQQWVLTAVEPKSVFTPTMRDEMVNTYVKQKLKTKSATQRTFGGGGWGEAEQLEVLLDAYETTGNKQYLNQAKYVYNYFSANVGSDWCRLVYTDNYKWYGHDFNDDVMWMIIAVARLGYISGSKIYSNAAKQNFDKILDRGYIPFAGMVRWAESSGDRYGTNACVNGPTEVAACYLGMGGCGEEYFEKARDIYAAQRKYLTNNMATGKVWDNVVWDPETETVKSKNEWASTYNQGTMMGAACLLYNHYGEASYLTDAQKIMSYTVQNMCDTYSVVKVCQDESNSDLCGFKGILVRYVRLLVTDLEQSDYKAWLIGNAMHAYCNRNAVGLTGTGWLTKATEESTANSFGCSTAASVAANVPFSEEEMGTDNSTAPATTTANSATTRFYNLAGMPLNTPPRHGPYIEMHGASSRVIINR